MRGKQIESGGNVTSPSFGFVTVTVMTWPLLDAVNVGGKGAANAFGANAVAHASPNVVRAATATDFVHSFIGEDLPKGACAHKRGTNLASRIRNRKLHSLFFRFGKYLSHRCVSRKAA